MHTLYYRLMFPNRKQNLNKDKHACPSLKQLVIPFPQGCFSVFTSIPTAFNALYYIFAHSLITHQCLMTTPFLHQMVQFWPYYMPMFVQVSSATFVCHVCLLHSLIWTSMCHCTGRSTQIRTTLQQIQYVNCYGLPYNASTEAKGSRST